MIQTPSRSQPCETQIPYHIEVSGWVQEGLGVVAKRTVSVDSFLG